MAAIIAGGVIIMMRDEIVAGYFRWQDYLVAGPLLYGAGYTVFLAASYLPQGDGLAPILVWPLRAALAFALMVFVWGGTLVFGALLMRVAAVALRRISRPSSA